jgi:hypothetical protein
MNKFEYNVTTLAALIQSWDSAGGTHKALQEATTKARATFKTVAAEMNKAAKLAGVVGGDASDTFLTGCRAVLDAHNKQLPAEVRKTEGAFRQMWSRAKKYAFAEEGATLVISAATEKEGLDKRAAILKGAAKERKYDREAAIKLIETHLNDDAFVINAVKLIAGLEAKKEIIRIDKVETPAPVVAAPAVTPAPVVAAPAVTPEMMTMFAQFMAAQQPAPVVGTIAPKPRATRARKAA